MKRIGMLIIIFAAFLYAQSLFDMGVASDDKAENSEILNIETANIDSAEEDTYSKMRIFLENIFDGKNVNTEDIIAGDDPELNGYISNIQIAPFDNNIISFEVTAPGDPSVKLVLYNIESQFVMRISAIEDYEQNIKMIPFPVKEMGANWHPSKNIFVFYSNGYENREQLFVVEVLDPHLMDESGIKISRIDFEEPKGTVNSCLYPDFNSTGDDIYFTVKIQKEDIKQKYNKAYNIAVADNILQYKETGFSKVKYDLMFNKKHDQIKPVCSPADPNVFAYISHKKEVKDGYGYANYYIIVYNRSNKTGVIVDNLSGFTDYPFQWSPTGNNLFYCNALSLSKTSKKFRDKRINKINLQVAEIGIETDKITSNIEKNANSEVIMGDVATKDKGMAFVGDNMVLMAKFDPYESIFLVDMNKWKANTGFYVKQLPIAQDNDFPVLANDGFIFLKYECFKTATVSSICKIPYEPKIDEEALKAKEERRKNRKSKKAKKALEESVPEQAAEPVEEVPAEVPAE
ncbi:MAG: hypothetical protein KKD38_09570 [Candidatus Delongbacteria bacterium]|nr:hypothetical protein [Candidatus Delongbacteria bacterium]MCG2760787.1 hypothetical protein [Candidatus Delongbacteria bacterium]